MPTTTDVVRKLGRHLGDGTVAENTEDLVNGLNSWKERTKDFVRANPVACLAGAFVLGFALAKVSRYA
jgi:hypothetical protein